MATPKRTHVLSKDERLRMEIELADNAKRDLGGLRVRYGKIQETNVYENKEEIPFYQFKG